MESPPPVEFAALARTLSSAAGVDATLDQIVTLAVRLLGCEYAGVAYANLRSRGVETRAASAEVVRQADDAQREVGEGPCLETMQDGTTCLVHDTAAEPRWPRWGGRAAGMGLHSAIAVRLVDGTDLLGALNLYASTAHAFTDEDVRVAETFATHASVALGRARKELHLTLAIDSRHLIGMAQGMLMERFALDEDTAFALLRRSSQQRNVKLRVVAELLLKTRALPDCTRLLGELPIPTDKPFDLRA